MTPVLPLAGMSGVSGQGLTREGLAQLPVAETGTVPPPAQRRLLPHPRGPAQHSPCLGGALSVSLRHPQPPQRVLPRKMLPRLHPAHRGSVLPGAELRRGEAPPVPGLGRWMAHEPRRRSPSGPGLPSQLRLVQAEGAGRGPEVPGSQLRGSAPFSQPVGESAAWSERGSNPGWTLPAAPGEHARLFPISRPPDRSELTSLLAAA